MSGSLENAHALQVIMHLIITGSDGTFGTFHRYVNYTQ